MATINGLPAMDTVLVEFAQRCNRLFVLSAPGVDQERTRIAQEDYHNAWIRLIEAGYSPQGVEVDLALEYVRAKGELFGMEIGNPFIPAG